MQTFTLESFNTERRLSSTGRRLVFLGHLADRPQPCLVLIGKQPFTPDAPFQPRQISWQQTFHNDIYYSLEGHAKEASRLCASVVYPASDKMIRKYEPSLPLLFLESAAIYQQVVKPFLLPEQAHLGWLHNILSGDSEADRILLQDPAFVLVKDISYSEANFKLLVLFRADIPSVRELRGEHLPLLARVKQAVSTLLRQQLGVRAAKMYFHYHPTFYRLHLHVEEAGKENPSSQCERALSLPLVQACLTADPLFFEKADLQIQVFEGSKLQSALKEAGHLN